ncbi:MAG TPA: ATP-dependent Clp protease ATP-binding subunit [bacterium]|nr:ATP-dependent Clp protease ATP-binding subunit [bacterium]
MVKKEDSKKEVRAFDKLSKNAKKCLLIASQISEILGKKEVEVVDLLVSILTDSKTLATKVIEEMGIDRLYLLDKLGVKNPEKYAKIKVSLNGNFVGRELILSEDLKEVISLSFQVANKYDHVYVGTEHFLIAILMVLLPETAVLTKEGLTLQKYMESLASYASYPVGLLSKPDLPEERGGKDSLLSQLGVELVSLASKGKLDPVIGRDEEIDKMVNILSRRKKNNPIVVGEAGVGKTVLVEALAQRIADGSVPSSLANFKIYAIDIPTIIAGSKMRGDVEQKMLQLVDEVIHSHNNILFIDEIQTVLTSGIQMGGTDITSILKPALLQQDFRCIGTTTTEDYSRYFDEDTALARRFQPVKVEEPSVLKTLEILDQVKPVLEKHHSMRISVDAIEAAVKLSDRFVSDRYLPDKAIDLLDEATATKRLEVEEAYHGLADLRKEYQEAKSIVEKSVKKGHLSKAKLYKKKSEKLEKELKNLESEESKAKKRKEYEVGVDTVKSIISKWTGIPIHTIDESESKMLLNLDETLSESIIGQEDAVKSVSGAIKRARAGISSIDKPWATFLFLGPTGVGKTELAKVLTRELFGDEKKLIQIDMSELMEQHSVSKLIGSPPGYVGFREGGQLTEAVRRNPYSVILFDEIEKAHSSVLNILLQVLEYGHLTDAKGKRINFKNTIIILTSNIGAEEISKDKILGFVGDEADSSEDQILDAYESMKEKLLTELKDELRPELLNRLDDVVIFRALTMKDAHKIAEILIGELNERLSEQNVSVLLSKSAINYITKEGFSEDYGARPLRRVIQDKVELLLADYILANSKNLRSSKKTVKVKIDLNKKKELEIIS